MKLNRTVIKTEVCFLFVPILVSEKNLYKSTYGQVEGSKKPNEATDKLKSSINLNIVNISMENGHLDRLFAHGKFHT